MSAKVFDSTKRRVPVTENLKLEFSILAEMISCKRLLINCWKCNIECLFIQINAESWYDPYDVVGGKRISPYEPPLPNLTEGLLALSIHKACLRF